MTLSETHSTNNVSLSDDDSEILRRRPPIITGPTFSLKGHPVDTKSASSAAVGICRRGDSHDDPRSGSLSSSSDSGGIIAEDGNVVAAGGGGGMTLSGRKKEEIEFVDRRPKTFARFVSNFPHQNVVYKVWAFYAEKSTSECGSTSL